MQSVIIPTAPEGGLNRESVVRIVPFTPCKIQLPVHGEFRPFVARITHDCQRNQRGPKQKAVHGQDWTRVENDTAEPDQGCEDLEKCGDGDVNQDVAVCRVHDLRVFPPCWGVKDGAVGQMMSFTSEPCKHGICQPHTGVPESYQDRHQENPLVRCPRVRFFESKAFALFDCNHQSTKRSRVEMRLRPLLRPVATRRRHQGRSIVREGSGIRPPVSGFCRECGCGFRTFQAPGRESWYREAGTDSVFSGEIGGRKMRAEYRGVSVPFQVWIS